MQVIVQILVPWVFVASLGTYWTLHEIENAVRADRVRVAKYVRKRLADLGDAATGTVLAAEIGGRKGLEP